MNRFQRFAMEKWCAKKRWRQWHLTASRSRLANTNWPH